MSLWTNRAVHGTAIGVAATALTLGLMSGVSSADNQAATTTPPATAVAGTTSETRTASAAVHQQREHLSRAERRALRLQREARAARLEAQRRANRAERREERARDMRQRAAEVAIAQIGDAYGYAGDGPSVFDCSGLTQYAWAKAGVSLTHYSRAQWSETRRISLKQAEPGDLAFYFENGAHHVAMYVGNGMVVGAVDYGIGVKKTPVVGTPWTNMHFSGMGRVI